MRVRTWWKFGVALAVAGGAFVYHHLKARKREPVRWSGGRNFGAFPPDLPESVFDEVSFL